MPSQEPYPLALWVDPSVPILEEYLKQLRSNAIQERRKYSSIKEQVIGRYETYLSENFQSELDEIEEIQIQLRNRSRGDYIPDTESSVCENPINNGPNAEGERFLLKKAYRQAALLHHPDKGGHPDDFHAAAEAFRAGDLGSLQELLLSKSRSRLSQIEYWQNEVSKPQVSWVQFKSTVQYKIAVSIDYGDESTAYNLSARLLEATKLRLIQMLFV